MAPKQSIFTAACFHGSIFKAPFQDSGFKAAYSTAHGKPGLQAQSFGVTGLHFNDTHSISHDIHQSTVQLTLTISSRVSKGSMSFYSFNSLIANEKIPSQSSVV